MSIIKKKSILVPTDFSHYSASALRSALEIARTQNGRIYLLHVVEAGRFWRKDGKSKALGGGDKESPQKKMEKQIVETGGAGSIEIATDMRTGVPHEEILRYQKEMEIDLIVMGSRSTKKGSVFPKGRMARKVVEQAGCSVLVVGD